MRICLLFIVVLASIGCFSAFRTATVVARRRNQYQLVRAVENSQSTVSNPVIENNIDDVFGAEFKAAATAASVDSQPTEVTYYKKNKIFKKKFISPERRTEVMKGYDNMRLSFILDSLFISVLGLCLVWGFGTLKDAYSYGIGSALGLAYAILLGRYVESIGGEGGGGRGAAGSARFAPVFLLILLYGKNREVISIIPELFGFFSYQLGSLLQIFNDNPYGDSEEEEVENNNDSKK
jgi:hypothetical protein